MNSFRALFRVLWLALVVVVLSILWVSTNPATAQGDPPTDRTATAPRIGSSSRNDESPTLRDMPLITPDGGGTREAPPVMVPDIFESIAAVEDPVVDSANPQGGMPAASRNFEGTSNINGVYPPDTNGDVGANHYVQTVNMSFQIWNKSGTSVYGPAAIRTLWQGFGGACEVRNDGDPVVLYDQFAQRWMISQFTTSNPYGECIAISTSSDPTGSYYRYFFQFSTTQLYDYPHFGIWPVAENSAYVMSANRFSSSYQGASAIAFERDKMVAGQAARFVEFSPPTAYGSLQPADLDGNSLPAADAPNPIISMGTNVLNIWKLRANWSNPAASTFTGPTVLPTAPFNRLCSGVSSCVPQPNTIQGLDALGDRVLQRLAYRHFATHDAMVITHAVNVNTTGIRGGVRWYEIRDPLGTPVIHQQSTYSPDATNRWMGSMAMDQKGNAALVYSVSSGTIFPSIWYAGRLAGDNPGTMGQGEAMLIAGTGSQTGSAARWGDYAAMSTDPVDDCTFWFTTEYIATTGGANWRTRVGAFAFPDCLRLTATVNHQAVCPGDNAVYALTAGTGYTGAVTLSAAGNPAPTTVTFSPNPLAPPFPATSNATVANTAGVAPGDYAITFTGLSASESSSVVAGLTVLPATLAAPALSAPADNALLGTTAPILTWGAIDGATGYTIEIAADPAFTDIVQSGTSATTTYAVSPALAADAIYYWRVRATSPCGESPTSAPSRFAILPTVSELACRADLDIPIPDNQPGGVTSALDIATTGMIVDIDVTTTLTHTWIGNLTARLKSPANTTVTMIDRPGANPGGPGCEQNHINVTLDDEAATAVEGVCAESTGDDPPPYAINGTYRPNNLLSAFDGEPLAGNWQLTVSDSVAGNTGRLRQWCVDATVVPLPDFSDLNPTYGVAWHNEATSLRLGALRSQDSAIPVPDGDDATDDGFSVDTKTDWNPGGSSSATVQVTGGSGYLAAWFDWNQNGQFDHPAEKVAGVNVSAGSNTIPFGIPSDAILDQPTAARFRLYAVAPGVESPTGAASDGEVEDTSSVAPQGIELSSFEAIREQDGVQAMWVTSAEWDMAGFNLWRAGSVSAPETRLNDTLIPSESPGNGQGASYAWLDSTALPEQTYFYWLESVTAAGQTRLYGPVPVQEDPTALTLVSWRAESGAQPVLPALLAAAIAYCVVRIYGNDRVKNRE